MLRVNSVEWGEGVVEGVEGSNETDLVLSLAFRKFTMAIRKARTRFTYKLFLTLRPFDF